MRSKIVKLCRIVGGVPGMMMSPTITEETPQYRALNAVVDDDMADVCLAIGLRHERTPEYLAEKTGFSVEYTTELADKLADAGVFYGYMDENGNKSYMMGIFAPGMLENMVNNREQLAKYPDIGIAFDQYTSQMGASMSAFIPQGVSFMRVFPIESSIHDNPDAKPWEHIDWYLDKEDFFSVSDCSCRAARRVAGTGCGHLEKDMCLHIGKNARFFANTGKAREITREEAKELVHRAEANGLMHTLPNIDEPGVTDAICNCCGCACFGMRIGLMYGARDGIRSNFVAQIDEAKCVACGQCVETCPGNALLLGQKICTKNPLPAEPSYRNQRDNLIWTKKDYDPDWREHRKNTVSTGTAPCKTACPAHVAVQGYLKLAAQGRYQDALALIKKENPLPAVCGRICNHKCETECTRGTVDQAVAIDDVKRFIADHDMHEDTRYVPPVITQTGELFDEKIAIIGAGPAGLSCAYYLATKGYKPTVFEKEEQLGGMLQFGIPSFRLEKDVLQAEIDIIKELGVTFKTGVEVGKDITIPELRSQGYKGFFLSIGAQGGRKVGVPGEDSEGVQTGIDFLKAVNLGEDVSLDGDTVVIGGGNVAVDVARTAARVSGENSKITMLCLESRDIMPAAADEVEEAEAEGIEVRCGWGPKEILTENGAVIGIVFQKCTRVFDANHKFSPEYDENDTVTIPCRNVLLSVGQSIQGDEVLRGVKIDRNPNGTIKADPQTYQTSVDDIFVGGDVYTGPRFAIDAIAAGKQAAISLHRAVHEGQSLTAGRDRREYTQLDKSNLSIDSYDQTARQIPGYNAERANTFRDSRMTMTQEQVRKETARCLECGATKVDDYLCIGCGICTTRCEFDAITLTKKYDVFSDRYEKVVFKVAENAVTRVAKKGAESVSKGVKALRG